MRILVTGSNGLLGQKIVAQLLSAKVDFKATSLGKIEIQIAHRMHIKSWISVVKQISLKYSNRFNRHMSFILQQ